MIGVMAALAAALAWTTASGLWRSLSDQGSALQLNALKNGLATLLFLPVLALLPWQDNAAAIAMLLLSGGVGIAAGDSFYLAALRRLGTRRTLTLEAVGPVLASLGSVMLMGERLGAGAWVGALLVAGAVVLVADSDGPLHRDRQGLALGLMAVLCGLSGAFLARQVLISSDLTPLQTAAVRLLGAGWLCCHSFEPEGRDSAFDPVQRCGLCWPPAWAPIWASPCSNWCFRPCPSALASR